KLVFGTQPGGAPVGLSLTPQPIVKIQDAAGNTVASSSLAVTISITPGSGPGGATLTCTSGTTVAASSGLAAFSGCSIDTVGGGYSLTATAGGVSGTTSTTFTIAAGS